MKISSIIKSDLAITKKEGEAVRDIIIQRLNQGKRITLHCGDLRCITTNFIYPIVMLIKIYSSDFFNKNVRFIGLGEFNSNMIKRCIDNIYNLKDDTMIRPDLNQLVMKVYAANKEKGFHLNEHTDKHYLCLVVSELIEAVEAHRKGKHARMKAFNMYYADDMDNSLFQDLFAGTIKDSIEDELADSVIRLLDLAGVRQYDLSVIPFRSTANISHNEFTENVYNIITELIAHDEAESIYCGISQIEYLCKSLDINLWEHVKWKLRYNQTRPYRHGKLY